VYPFTVGLVVRSKRLREEVLAALQAMPARLVQDQESIGDISTFVRSVEQNQPDVLLVDITGLKDSLEQIADALKKSPSCPLLIALHETAEPELILRAMRLGFREYFYMPLSETLRPAVEKLLAEQRQARESQGKSGRTLGIVSAKGGCGATTIACHVAYELRRQSLFEVLLADFDLYSGMVHFFMKTKSAYSVEDAFQNLHRLDASYWRALISNGTPRLEVITAPDPATLREMPTPEQMIKVLSFVRTQYDWSVIDLGRNMNFLGLSILDEIDETCLVTTLEIPALHRAKQILQKLTDSGYGRNRLRLVLNKLPHRQDITPVELEKMLGWPVYALLPDDSEALYESYSEGKLLPQSAKLSKNIAQLARKLAGIPEPKQQGFFSRRGKES
jgi:pilus assembly protein CpaE